MAEAAAAPPEQPVLLLICDVAELSARVRSHTHHVVYWTAGDCASTDEFCGDPTESATYEWTRAVRGVTAVIDLTPVDRAKQAMRALRTARSDAAVLILSQEAADVDGDRDGTLARGGELRDVVRLDLDDEIARLEAERRAYCLRRFAQPADVVPILIHDEPDPDAVSSALAVATLLGGSLDRTPIVTLDATQRPENRRMSELLHLRITQITPEELERFPRIVLVDTQPTRTRHPSGQRLAVIDHHPINDSYDAEFMDVRPEYGATATMLTEYLRAVMPERIRGALATALLFGIKTDTDALKRGVSAADVTAYALLQGCADVELVRRMERPSYAPETARRYGVALANAACAAGLCTAFLGELQDDEAHVLTGLADFCLTIEHITWVVIGAFVQDELVLSVRHAGGGEVGAGDVARRLAGRVGSGGGHATMARVNAPASAASALLQLNGDEEIAAALHRTVQRHIAGLQEIR